MLPPTLLQPAAAGASRFGAASRRATFCRGACPPTVLSAAIVFASSMCCLYPCPALILTLHSTNSRLSFHPKLHHSCHLPSASSLHLRSQCHHKIWKLMCCKTELDKLRGAISLAAAAAAVTAAFPPLEFQVNCEESPALRVAANGRHDLQRWRAAEHEPRVGKVPAGWLGRAGGRADGGCRQSESLDEALSLTGAHPMPHDITSGASAASSAPCPTTLAAHRVELLAASVEHDLAAWKVRGPEPLHQLSAFMQRREQLQPSLEALQVQPPSPLCPRYPAQYLPALLIRPPPPHHHHHHAPHLNDYLLPVVQDAVSIALPFILPFLACTKV